MIEYRILTTENVPFTYQVAGVGSRFLAWFLDQIAIVVLAAVGVGIAWVVESMTRGAGFGEALLVVWVFVSRTGYFVLFEWLWLGQTLGKRALGIRVIQEQGTGLGLYQSLVRNVLRFVDLLPFAYALGLAVASGNRLNRRLGDLAAGTLVVHVDKATGPVRSLHEPTAAAVPERETLWRQRLGALSRDQKQTLIDVCLRRDQLRLSDRASLFTALSQYLQNNLQLSPGEHQSDEKFVQQAARVLTIESSKTAD